MLSKNIVSVIKTKDYFYPHNPPYNPSQLYSELNNIKISKENNYVYDSIRRLLYEYGLDEDNFNSIYWNPFKEFVKPGNTIVLKPNFVTHYNHARFIDGTTDMNCVVTHGSVIRCVLDYVALALKGDGKVIITDCPIQGTDWDKLLSIIGIAEIKEDFKKRFPNIDLLVKDFRLGKAKIIGRTIISRETDESKKDSFYEIDIGENSLLLPLMPGKCEFGVSQYSKRRMMHAHTPLNNKYLIPKEIINADFFINLP